MSEPAKEIQPAWNVMIIRGDDQELVARRVRELVSAIRVDGADVIDVTAGMDDVDQALRAANQSFMFSERALVVVREASKLSADERQLATAVIENGVDPNFLIFVELREVRSAVKEDEAEAENTGSSKDNLIELVKKCGGIEIVKSPTGKGDRRSFVEDAARGFQLTLSPGAISLLVEHLADDLGRLESILRVLESRYGSGVRIESDDLAEYLGDHGAVPFWDLTEAIEKGDASAALAVLRTITVDQGRDPVILIAVIGKRLSELASIASPSITRGDDVNSALRRSGLLTGKGSKHPYVAGKMIPIARSLDFGDFRQAFNWISEADRALRGDPVLPPDMALEILVARLCSMYRRKRKVPS